MKRSIVSVLGLALAAGCGGADEGAQAPVGKATAALVALNGCGEVEAVIKQQALDAMNRTIDKRIAALREASGPTVCYDEEMALAGGGPTSAPASGSTGGGAKSASGTNNQVAGVDEADLVKNDGKFLYIAGPGGLTIVEAWPAEQMHTVAKVSFEGTARKLFIEGDRALVYVSVPRASSGEAGAPYPGQGGECTYGYDCQVSADGSSTRLVVLDIKDRSKPQVVREVTLSGSLISARKVGSAVHTVVSQEELIVPGLRYHVDGASSCGKPLTPAEVSRLEGQYEELRRSNAQKIQEANVLGALPRVQDPASAADSSCRGFYRSTVSDGAAFTSIVSLDMTAARPATSSTVVSRPGHVYASAESLYLAVPHQHSEYRPWFDGFDAQPEASTIHRFRIGADPALTAYQASGLVRGRVLNQFAMDEWQGNLRVATTTGHLPSPDVESTLTVLEPSGAALVPVGAVEHIAPSEDIRSVRFDGDRGYVVTFKKTDPLFVFDLADPRAPKTLGELKIPGFSTYMHRMDKDHLLTIGYDADDQGSFAYFDSVLLQIFNVSDPSAPKLAHKTTIGTRGSSSEALTNHLAFTYVGDKNLLAVPMTVCEGGGNGSYGTNMTFSGLIVYDVTASGGFAEKGRVEHPMTSTGGYDNAACGNWWTQASSEVKRSVVMDDVVFSISERVVKARALGQLSAPLSEVSLEAK